ncbi:MAG: pyridoxamine 5'-phosphate oxidase [Spirochaetales bacterium]|nr:pyridoxamine 5'-phosphate oxidase [Leptospiraceae bacterium]MCP5482941.1 pyridoxamine 5'-phosphate oxidase [Spirochaetales bacterium]MCP5484879.1 pyridoxamine 5'-phosphate oxidase [Spirochaetales bacterium]
MLFRKKREKELRGIKVDFGQMSLLESEAGEDPFALFDIWFSAALQSGTKHPNAMVLATASDSGFPSARVLLLKDYDRDGFVFFTNYQSRKGREIAGNPRGAMLFYWPELEKQVRINGMFEKVSAAESEEYFASRPRGSQIGAHASMQSSVVSGRPELEGTFAGAEREFAGRDVPRPEHWGGYRLRPESIEFWQGRENRMHDRLLFTRQGKRWRRERLAP